MSGPQACISVQLVSSAELEKAFNVNNNPGLWTTQKVPEKDGALRLKSVLFPDYCLGFDPRSGNALAYLEKCGTTYNPNQALYIPQKPYFVSDTNYEVLSCPYNTGATARRQGERVPVLSCPQTDIKELLDHYCECMTNLNTCELKCQCPNSEGKILVSSLTTTACGFNSTARTTPITLEHNTGLIKCELNNLPGDGPGDADASTKYALAGAFCSLHGFQETCLVDGVCINNTFAVAEGNCACCYPEGESVCQLDDVVACVLDFDSHCEGNWDEQCASEARERCGMQCPVLNGSQCKIEAPSCCNAHVGPRCGETNSAIRIGECVCEFDSYCCTQQWDDQCVAEAIESCSLSCSDARSLGDQ